VHPEVRVTRVGESTIRLARGEARARIEIVGGAVSIANGTWQPEFGVSRPNLVLVVEQAGKLPHRFETRIHWFD
jgi:hypothetical protein